MRAECAELREELMMASSAASSCSTAPPFAAGADGTVPAAMRLLQELGAAAKGSSELRECAAREATLRAEWIAAVQSQQQRDQVIEREEEEALLHLQCAGLRKRLTAGQPGSLEEEAAAVLRKHLAASELAEMRLECCQLREEVAVRRTAAAQPENDGLRLQVPSSKAQLDLEELQELQELRHECSRLRSRMAAMSRGRRALEQRVGALCGEAFGKDGQRREVAQLLAEAFGGAPGEAFRQQWRSFCDSIDAAAVVLPASVADHMAALEALQQSVEDDDVEEGAKRVLPREVAASPEEESQSEASAVLDKEATEEATVSRLQATEETIKQLQAALEQARDKLAKAELAREQDRSTWEEERSQLDKQVAALENSELVLKAACEQLHTAATADGSAFEDQRDKLAQAELVGEQDRSAWVEERSQLDKQVAALENSELVLKDACEQLHTAATADRSAFEDQRDKLAQSELVGEQDRSAWEEERSQLDKQVAALENSELVLKDACEQLHTAATADRSAFEGQRDKLAQAEFAREQDRSAWEEERLQLDKQVAALENSELVLKDACEQLHTAATADRSAFEDQRDKLAQAELEERSQLDKQVAALENSELVLKDACEHFTPLRQRDKLAQAELVGEQDRSAWEEERSQLDKQVAALENSELVLKDACEQLHTAATADRSFFEEQHDKLAQAELVREQDRSAWEEERSQLDKQVAALENSELVLKDACEQLHTAATADRSAFEGQRDKLVRAASSRELEQGAWEQLQIAFQQLQGQKAQLQVGLQQEREKLAQAATAREQDRSAWEGEKLQLREQAATLEGTQLVLKDECEQLRVTATVGRGSKVAEGLQDRMAELQAGLEDEREKLARAACSRELERSAWEQERLLFREEAATLRGSQEAWKVQCQQLRASVDVSASREPPPEIQQHLAELQAALEQERDKLAQAATAREQDRSAWEEERLQLREQAATLEGTHLVLKDECEQLRAAPTTSRDDKIVKRLEEHLADVQTALEDNQAKLARANAAKDRRQSAWQQERLQLREEAATLRGSQEALKRQCDQFGSSADSHARELDQQLQDHKAQLQVGLQQEREKLGQAELAWEQGRNAWEGEILQLREQAATLEGTQLVLKDECEQLRVTATAGSSKVAEGLQDRMVELQAGLEDERGKLARAASSRELERSAWEQERLLFREEAATLRGSQEAWKVQCQQLRASVDVSASREPPPEIQHHLAELQAALEQERDKLAQATTAREQDRSAWEGERLQLREQAATLEGTQLVLKDECEQLRVTATAGSSKVAEGLQDRMAELQAGLEDEREKLARAASSRKLERSAWEQERLLFREEAATLRGSQEAWKVQCQQLRASVDVSASREPPPEIQHHLAELQAALEQERDKLAQAATAREQDRSAWEGERLQLREQAATLEGIQLVLKDECEQLRVTATAGRGSKVAEGLQDRMAELQAGLEDEREKLARAASSRELERSAWEQERILFREEAAALRGSQEAWKVQCQQLRASVDDSASREPPPEIQHHLAELQAALEQERDKLAQAATAREQDRSAWEEERLQLREQAATLEGTQLVLKDECEQLRVTATAGRGSKVAEGLQDRMAELQAGLEDEREKLARAASSRELERSAWEQERLLFREEAATLRGSQEAWKVQCQQLRASVDVSASREPPPEIQHHLAELQAALEQERDKLAQAATAREQDRSGWEEERLQLREQAATLEGTQLVLKDECEQLRVTATVGRGSKVAEGLQDRMAELQAGLEDEREKLARAASSRELERSAWEQERLLFREEAATLRGSQEAWKVQCQQLRASVDDSASREPPPEIQHHLAELQAALEQERDKLAQAATAREQDRSAWEGERLQLREQAATLEGTQLVLKDECEQLRVTATAGRGSKVAEGLQDRMAELQAGLEDEREKLARAASSRELERSAWEQERLLFREEAATLRGSQEAWKVQCQQLRASVDDSASREPPPEIRHHLAELQAALEQERDKLAQAATAREQDRSAWEEERLQLREQAATLEGTQLVLKEECEQLWASADADAVARKPPPDLQERVEELRTCLDDERSKLAQAVSARELDRSTWEQERLQLREEAASLRGVQLALCELRTRVASTDLPDLGDRLGALQSTLDDMVEAAQVAATRRRRMQGEEQEVGRKPVIQEDADSTKPALPQGAETCTATGVNASISSCLQQQIALEAWQKACSALRNQASSALGSHSKLRAQRAQLLEALASEKGEVEAPVPVTEIDRPRETVADDVSLSDSEDAGSLSKRRTRSGSTSVPREVQERMATLELVCQDALDQIANLEAALEEERLGRVGDDLSGEPLGVPSDAQHRISELELALQQALSRGSLELHASHATDLQSAMEQECQALREQAAHAATSQDDLSKQCESLQAKLNQVTKNIPDDALEPIAALKAALDEEQSKQAAVQQNMLLLRDNEACALSRQEELQTECEELRSKLDVVTSLDQQQERISLGVPADVQTHIAELEAALEQALCPKELGTSDAELEQVAKDIPDDALEQIAALKAALDEEQSKQAAVQQNMLVLRDNEACALSRQEELQTECGELRSKLDVVTSLDQQQERISLGAPANVQTRIAELEAALEQALRPKELGTSDAELVQVAKDIPDDALEQIAALKAALDEEQSKQAALQRKFSGLRGNEARALSRQEELQTECEELRSKLDVGTSLDQQQERISLGVPADVQTHIAELEAALEQALRPKELATSDAEMVQVAKDTPDDALEQIAALKAALDEEQSKQAAVQQNILVLRDNEACALSRQEELQTECEELRSKLDVVTSLDQQQERISLGVPADVQTHIAELEAALEQALRPKELGTSDAELVQVAKDTPDDALEQIAALKAALDEEQSKQAAVQQNMLVLRDNEACALSRQEELQTECEELRSKLDVVTSLDQQQERISLGVPADVQTRIAELEAALEQALCPKELATSDAELDQQQERISLGVPADVQTRIAELEAALEQALLPKELGTSDAELVQVAKDIPDDALEQIAALKAALDEDQSKKAAVQQNMLVLRDNEACALSRQEQLQTECEELRSKLDVVTSLDQQQERISLGVPADVQTRIAELEAALEQALLPKELGTSDAELVQVAKDTPDDALEQIAALKAALDEEQSKKAAVQQNMLVLRDSEACALSRQEELQTECEELRSKLEVVTSLDQQQERISLGVPADVQTRIAELEAALEQALRPKELATSDAELVQVAKDIPDDALEQIAALKAALDEEQSTKAALQRKCSGLRGNEARALSRQEELQTECEELRSKLDVVTSLDQQQERISLGVPADVQTHIAELEAALEQALRPKELGTSDAELVQVVKDLPDDALEQIAALKAAWDEEQSKQAAVQQNMLVLRDNEACALSRQEELQTECEELRSKLDVVTSLDQRQERISLGVPADVQTHIAELEAALEQALRPKELGTSDAELLQGAKDTPDDALEQIAALKAALDEEQSKQAAVQQNMLVLRDNEASALSRKEELQTECEELRSKLDVVTSLDQQQERISLGVPADVQTHNAELEAALEQALCPKELGTYDAELVQVAKDIPDDALEQIAALKAALDEEQSTKEAVQQNMLVLRDNEACALSRQEELQTDCEELRSKLDVVTSLDQQQERISLGVPADVQTRIAELEAALEQALCPKELGTSGTANLQQQEPSDLIELSEAIFRCYSELPQADEDFTVSLPSSLRGTLQEPLLSLSLAADHRDAAAQTDLQVSSLTCRVLLPRRATSAPPLLEQENRVPHIVEHEKMVLQPPPPPKRRVLCADCGRDAQGFGVAWGGPGSAVIRLSPASSSRDVRLVDDELTLPLRQRWLQGAPPLVPLLDLPRWRREGASGSSLAVSSLGEGLGNSSSSCGSPTRLRAQQGARGPFVEGPTVVSRQQSDTSASEQLVPDAEGAEAKYHNWRLCAELQATGEGTRGQCDDGAEVPAELYGSQAGSRSSASRSSSCLVSAFSVASDAAVQFSSKFVALSGDLGGEGQDPDGDAAAGDGSPEDSSCTATLATAPLSLWE
ncbi:unnamed protein product, partial [Polarella glacialis]